MYQKRSPIDQITAGAKSFELLMLNKYSNLVVDEQCENGDLCGDCVKKISVLFILYRFMVIVSYLLVLSGLWLLEVIVRKTICNRCHKCQRNRIKTAILEQNKIISSLDSTANSETDRRTSVLDSSGDSVHENVHFLTYREEETEDDGFQDDNYNDILANSQFADDDMQDLETLLQPSEIDWDFPVPIEVIPSLDDSFRDDSSEIYFDEDYVTILGADTLNDFETLQKHELLENTYFKNYDYDYSKYDSATSSNSPIFDDEVLAAIVGSTNKEVILSSGVEIENEWYQMSYYNFT